MKNEELVDDTLATLIDFLPKVIDETRNTAELFHSDREAAALSKLVYLIDAYTWVIDATNGMKRIGYIQDLNLEGITNFLKEIEYAMSIQDFIAVSDILEYEIAEVLKKWNEDLNSVCNG